MIKRTAYPILLVCCLLVTFISCSNRSSSSRKKVILEIQPKKTTYVYGEKVTITASTDLKAKEIESIKLLYNNETIAETIEPEIVLNDYELQLLGNGIFKIVITKTDGTNTSKPLSIKTLSNIVPKKYSYQVVNSYPHLTTSYTQGLEYYKGYLYEGTGEYGESKLYQLDLRSGQPIQTFTMNDNYFGEGITILDNNIYQLTYFAQTGFVYNMDDFSVIDSFSYASKEGWGLTNDGENLIMGNGSHNLIWLNPADFSTIKTLQVANNNDIMSNLNELEYVDGIIYANIYTTNLVLEIDAESGRILSEINLTGLLNLYDSGNVDYLNGIAYDKENDRLFVTGKYWPRLFEIKLVESE